MKQLFYVFFMCVVHCPLYIVCVYCPLYITLEPETSASHPKYQKTQIAALSSGWCPGPGKVG